MHSILKRHRALGVVFIGMLALALWLVVAIFNQSFKKFDEVTLVAGTAGLQLPDRADVKIRGVIIGQVLSMESGGERGAVVELGIEPDKMREIPGNVTAAILPKTLFGEKFVDLTIPADPAGTPLEAGQTIEQTDLPVEVERVLNDLYPLLRTIQPAELNYTLNALATALEGRGDKLGETLVTLDAYLRKLNPEVPALMEDIRLLAEVTDVYGDVLPQLAEVLRNTTLTGNTLVEKEQQLNAFLRDLTSFSDTTTEFLNDNGNNIVRLAQVSEPILALLERYSPTSECLVKGLVRQAPRLASTFRGFVFHIDLVVLDEQPRGYTEADRTVYGADNGPDCAQLPNPPIPFGELPNFDDGADGLNKANQRVAPGVDDEVAAATAAVGQPNRSRMSVGPSGTPDQKAMFNSLLAPVLDTPVDEMSDVSTLLFAPAFAGTEVSVR
ncbi:MCE family protein [Nocardioides aequoreus]|uniref:MCE family protein n=1 Tax=Nocardioides aequoreus TaxID=397278 RepID=UPI0004C32729|nr:MCE family protein [Nocardioides aequoreus]